MKEEAHRKHAGDCVVPPTLRADATAAAGAGFDGFASVQCQVHIGIADEMTDLSLEFGVGASDLRLDFLVLTPRSSGPTAMLP